jgi:hypothetical protein
LAKRKWPSSWINIINPNIKIAIKIFISNILS